MGKKTIVTIVLMLAVFLIAKNSFASVTDPPHNPAHGINCGDCHSYSLWWKYSPDTQNTAPGTTHADITNAICSKCHNDSSLYPNVMTHNGTSYYDGWSLNCVDCHDPHYQAQLAWLNDATNPATIEEVFLVTGHFSNAAAIASLTLKAG